MREERPAADQTPFSKPWSNFGQMRQFFEQIRERVGETRYFEELGLAGVSSPAEFRICEQGAGMLCEASRNSRATGGGIA